MNLMEDALNSLRTRKLRPKDQILVLEEDLGRNRDQDRQDLEPGVQDLVEVVTKEVVLDPRAVADRRLRKSDLHQSFEFGINH